MSEIKSKQCAKCPWRVDTDPHEILNGYSVDKHKALSCTIAKPGDPHGLFGGTLRVMACHDSTPGKEYACAGWLANQLGPGNNIALRMRVMSGAIPCPDVDGEQHRCFEDTLP